MSDIDDARKLLEDNGFVVLREKSYRQAQERQRVAEALRRAAEEDSARTRKWVQTELGHEIRYLRDRCTFIYGEARAAGCSVEQLSGGPSFDPPRSGGRNE
ncbi:hypothetical protein SEA_DELIAN_68 [Gordonia phage Delian]|uniref:hypothetical protein n=1 Tax=Gordonia phage Utz TaxID=1838081 RepID=UPI0007B630C3|nr:hypothetical protein BH796_gp57 [Gordonia phage Utz]YP_009287282.1 hypothetical protein BIZ76_gp65 [Gordonia phage CaptainKirk2]QDH85386.1 hypothetical protein SEA_MINTFEN_65 [Gordonia phage MintFen]QGH77988.1 hypothetical protein SEA_DELIAN_68 [Gordonia phage Delian]ANA86924.1 hypothetical protein PBI_UTZ_57 [Gordonia phage Utz]AOE44008.1 hypothetical protein SEA_CAPTAINKIRK2_65 [Gordonia phage CaptainKirk2]